MDFLPKHGKKRRNIQEQLAGNPNFIYTNNNFPLPIQMYRESPNEDISLTEFKELALNRRNLLKEIEYANGKYQKWGEEWKGRMRELCRTHKLNVVQLDGDVQLVRRRDYISHFLLRLSYSQSEHLRRWMVSHEVDLFRYRFDSITLDNRMEFMANDSEFKKYTPISDSEFKTVQQCILDSYIKFHRDRIMKDNIKFYKVPFTLVPSLVATRSIYIQEGYAYLPAWDLHTIVTNAFRAKLSLALTTTSRKLDNARDDDRIWKFLSDLDTYYEGPDYKGTRAKKNSETVGIQDIEDLYRESYPLCMVNLHSSLKKEHHLRHWGRMQYGLFLKGIGIGMEDSLRFWREEFSKGMDPDKFDKQYAYNVRHHYGHEGRRTSYSAYSCSKIITCNPPAPNDNHGCPYKHFDRANLKKLLASQGVQDKPMKGILDLAADKQYNNACLRYFETKHEIEGETSLVMDHPNRYFDESRYILSGKHPTKIRTETKAPAGPIKMETSVTEKVGTTEVTEDFGDIDPAEFEDLDI